MKNPSVLDKCNRFIERLMNIMGDTTKGDILIIGGGISGISAAVEIAEFGHHVTIVERESSLGGRVARSYQYFPKLCPPYCGLEIYYKRIRSNPNIDFITMGEVEKIDGTPGDFNVSVRIAPRYVNGKCTGCGDCIEACPVERANDWNYGMDNTKAIHLPHELSFPLRYVIDDSVCPGSECAKCVPACKYDAIELDMQPTEVQVKADAVIVATGWKPYDATNVDYYHFGEFKNVITNTMMERIAAPNGPTKGDILRPSDQKKVEKVAFVQCAGSRDENHLPFCSSVCCMASLKQSTYVREFNPDATVHMFYIDLRAPGRQEDFLQKMQKDEKLHLVKGKVAEIQEDSESGDLTVVAEDIYSGNKYQETVDLVVLATGMQPTLYDESVPFDIQPDKNGFFPEDNGSDNGIYFLGCAKSPSDVSSCIKDANGVALMAMQCIGRKEKS
jgi:quinone-modifying oxidoreductase subunit QmoA